MESAAASNIPKFFIHCYLFRDLSEILLSEGLSSFEDSVIFKQCQIWYIEQRIGTQPQSVSLISVPGMRGVGQKNKTHVLFYASSRVFFVLSTK